MTYDHDNSHNSNQNPCLSRHNELTLHIEGRLTVGTHQTTFTMDPNFVAHLALGGLTEEIYMALSADNRVATYNAYVSSRAGIRFRIHLTCD
jgi:hypothetical protein